jgi:uncharacterized repeat protein (TIGR01451 family)
VADEAEVDAGDAIGYTITVTNGGEGAARAVTLTDTLPANDGLVWSLDQVQGGWACGIADGVLVCGGEDFDLGAGESASVHLSSPTTQETCGVVENAASATTANDGAPSTGPVAIVVDCPGIDIDKTPDSTPVVAGTSIGFTITVTNDGPAVAKDVQVSDTLPANAGLSWTIDGGSGAQMCAIAAGVLTCSFGDMGPTTSYAVHIASGTTTASCGLIDNTATVTTVNGPGDTDGAQITVNCPVTPPPPPPPPPPSALGVDIEKSGPELAHVGDTITYTLTVKLTTAERLANIVLTDPNCDAGAPTYASGDDADFVLEPGEVWTYTCLHLVTEDDPDPLPNTASVTGTSGDGRTATDSDDHVVDLIHPDIRIVKDVDPPSGQPGDVVTYSYTVTNTGDVVLYDVSVDDDVIGHVGDIAALEPGEQVTLTVEWVLPADSIEVLNVGLATGTDVLGAQVSDDDDAVVTIVEALTPPPTAFTGSEALRLGELTALLLVAGSLALAVGRRRRTVV